MNQAELLQCFQVEKSGPKVFWCCLFLLVAAAVLGVFGSYYALLPAEVTNLSFKLFATIIWFEAVCLMILFVIFSRFFLDPRPGLVLTPSGFTFWNLKISTRVVPWHNVDRIEIVQKIPFGSMGLSGFRFVNVFLKPDHNTELRRTLLKRFLGPGDIVIEHRFLKSSAPEILDAMNAYWNASMDQASGNDFSYYPRA